MADARLWCYAGIPAFVYGSTTEGTGVEISDYLHVVKTHVLSVFDYSQTVNPLPGSGFHVIADLAGAQDRP